MKKILSLLVALGALPALAPAQNATTTPVGVKTTTIFGNGSVSFLSIDLLASSSFVGQPVSVAGTSLTFSGVDFTSLLTSGASYYLEVSNGNGVGQNALVNSWTATGLATASDISAYITANSTTVSLRRLPTISDVFGSTNDVLNGGSATTADLIYIKSPATDGIKVYYYSTGGFAGIGWRQIGGGTSNKASEPIYTTSGIYILKKSAGNSEITITGEVKDTNMLVTMPPGFLPYGGFPSGITLVSSGLYNASAPASSVTSGSATTADLIYTDSDNNGVLEIYYYSSGGFAGIGWRQVGGGTASKDNISLANGFGILNKNTTKALNINTPL